MRKCIEHIGLKLTAKAIHVMFLKFSEVILMFLARSETCANEGKIVNKDSSVLHISWHAVENFKLTRSK